MIPYTLNDTGLTFYLKGQKTFRRDFAGFDQLVAAVQDGDVEAINLLVNKKQYVARISQGNVMVTQDDEVLYKEQPVPEYLATRILEHIKANVSVFPLLAFTEKLMQNPSKTGVVNDLFRWLEVGQMPIYADGDFLAYKRVRHDFTPIHNGPYGKSQKVGEVVTQPRETCNENRSTTCASGLHFCSYEYLPTFVGDGNTDKIIVLKINPADVVAIPNDYNDTKGRCCRFLVVEEVPLEEIQAAFGGRLVVGQIGVYQSEPEAEVKTEAAYDNVMKRSRAEKALEAAGGNKTKAALDLGVSRSTLTRWLELVVPDAHDSGIDEVDFEDEYSDEEPSNYEKAVDALNEADGNKTKAATALGISRSTLTRWLESE